MFIENSAAPACSFFLSAQRWIFCWFPELPCKLRVQYHTHISELKKIFCVVYKLAHLVRTRSADDDASIDVKAIAMQFTCNLTWYNIMYQHRLSNFKPPSRLGHTDLRRCEWLDVQRSTWNPLYWRRRPHSCPISQAIYNSLAVANKFCEYSDIQIFDYHWMHISVEKYRNLI
jgi:hypothetical protein